MEQKPNVLPIILAVIITALVVGGGMYYYQNLGKNTKNRENSQLGLSNQEKGATPTVQGTNGLEGQFKKPLFFNSFLEPITGPKTADIVALYSNFQYNFNFVTNKGCENWWKFQEEAEGVSSKYVTANISVYVPSSKQWPKGSVWYNYMILNQAQLDFALKEKSTKNIGTAEWDAALYMNQNYQKLSSGYYLVRINPQESPEDIPLSCALDIQIN